MTTKPLYQILASALQSREHCLRGPTLNTVWADRWDEVIHNCLEELPHGSGFDVKITLSEPDTFRADRIVLCGSYHAMDEYGGYDGFRDYTVTVSPAFGGVKLYVRGAGEYREYIAERIGDVLEAKYDPAAFHDDPKALRAAQ
jgi:hypothetical protein